MTDQMTPAERLRAAARTLRDDIREPYDAPLADWLDDTADEVESHATYSPSALAVADAVLGGE